MPQKNVLARTLPLAGVRVNKAGGSSAETDPAIVARAWSDAHAFEAVLVRVFGRQYTVKDSTQQGEWEITLTNVITDCNAELAKATNPYRLDATATARYVAIIDGTGNIIGHYVYTGVLLNNVPHSVPTPLYGDIVIYAVVAIA